jgi:hypothetical protein
MPRANAKDVPERRRRLPDVLDYHAHLPDFGYLNSIRAFHDVRLLCNARISRIELT